MADYCVPRWRGMSRTNDMLKRFDPGSMPSYALTVVLGPAKSGKTIINDILRHKPHLTTGCVMTDVYDAQALTSCMRRQEACPTEQAYVVGTVPLNDLAVREVWMNGRCMRLFCVFALQNPSYIRPDLRANIDFLVLTREEDVAVLRSIWKMFSYALGTFGQFKHAMMLAAQEHSALVVDLVLCEMSLYHLCRVADTGAREPFGCPKNSPCHQQTGTGH